MRNLSSYIRPTDVVLGFNSFDGIAGIRILMGATLNGCTRIVNAGPFSPERFFKLVERFKVTFSLSSAFQPIQILKHPQIQTANLTSYKHYICAGTKVSYDIIQQMNNYLRGGKFCHSYGMTELVGPITVNLDHMKNDCVGQLASGCEAKIVNEQGDRLGIDEDGELCIKQPYLFLGYLGDNRNIQQYFDDEGFFITGDIARFDANGDLFIIDRKKELFKCNGYHVTPCEIEEFLNKIEGVKQSCVVPIPDPICDYLPAVVIEKATNSTCTAEFIYNSVSSELKRILDEIIRKHLFSFVIARIFVFF